MGNYMSKSKYKIISSDEESKRCSVPISWLSDRSSSIAVTNGKQMKEMQAIGKGKFGLVFLAKQVNTSKHVAIKHVAIKFISKQFIFECQSLARIQQELDISLTLRHPFIIYFYCAYETPTCYALVSEYAPGGEFFTLLKKSVKLPEFHSKFYFCEIALALEYLHNRLIIVYRDLKPENILLDAYGHIKLCDFGFAVNINNDRTLIDGCGTAMYISPEIATGKKSHGFPVDWWSLGCILFEMLSGYAPFGDTEKMSKFEIFNNINRNSIQYPIFMPLNAKKVIRSLLETSPEKRFNFEKIQECAWLKDIIWDDFLELKIEAPWKPSMNDLKEPNSNNFLNWDSVKLPVDQPSTEALGYCCSLILPQPNSTHDNIRKSKTESKRKSHDETDLDLQIKNKQATNGRRASISGATIKILPEEAPHNGNNINKAPLVRRGSVGDLNR